MHAHSNFSWWRRGDLDGFFGLFVDNLIQLVLASFMLWHKRLEVMMNVPEVKHDELNVAIREEKIDEANQLLAGGFKAEFSATDFRAIVLCGLNVEGQDFSNSYFRMADMRGLDLRTCNMEGASLHDAIISGTYFPPELDASEIEMSIKHGTRLRYKT